MRIVDIREQSVPISRYADPALPSGGLNTSAVALTTDVMRGGRPIVGFGFASIGRFAQGGLIRERFAPRLLEVDLASEDGANIDPFRGWDAMMRGEKPGGHGERCVAVGTLDMAIWDAAAKIADMPLHRFLAERVPDARPHAGPVPVYAGGGYYYPEGDLARLQEEVRAHLGDGYTHVKIKIGSAPLARDVQRIEAVLALLHGPDHLAVDAMNTYDAGRCLQAAAALAPYTLRWFEDICDPLDFDTHCTVTATYQGPVAAGEALFSDAEARLLQRYAGLRPDRDILLFDPVHCYGLPGFLRIVRSFDAAGWPRSAFWPHGGHLFTLHLVSALGLGGAEVNPLCFQPFGGLAGGVLPSAGRATPPHLPGIGFESRPALRDLFNSLL